MVTRRQFIKLSSIAATLPLLSQVKLISPASAAAIEKGTTPEQRTIITTVAELADCVRAEDLKAPTLFIIGEVVEFSESLSWAAAVIDCGLEAHG